MSPVREFIIVVCLSAVTALAIVFAACRERTVRKEMAEIASERGDWASKLSAAQAEREAAAAQSADLETALEKLKQASEESKNALQACEKTRAELASKLEALSKELQAAKPETPVVEGVEALGKELRAAQTQAASEIQAAVSAIGTKVDQAIQGLQPIVQSIGKLAELEAKISDATAAKEETSKKLGEQAALVEKNAAVLAALAKGLEALGQEVIAQNAVRKAESESAKREFETMRSELAKIRASLEEIALAMASRASDQGTAQRPPLPASTIVRTASGLAVVIEAGEKQGVEPGDLLYVSRSGKPVAAIQVVNVYATLSGARVVEVVRGENVRPGDAVSRARPPGWAVLDREGIPQEGAPPAVPPPPPAPKP